VERRLATDAAWAQELARLRECLAATGDPTKCGDDPPLDLVQRTCYFVERACEGAQATPVAAALTAPLCGGARAPWTLSDLTVGAGVLFALGMLLAPALRESRDASRRLVCQNNLASLGSALFDYQQAHNRRLPTVDPGQQAGEFILKLAESGFVSPAQLLEWRVCPDSPFAEAVAAGRVPQYLPSRVELGAARGEQLALLLAWSGGSFAYRIGYYDREGRYHNMLYTGDSNRPMLSDAPEFSGQGLRSGSHGACGQNVLYQNLSVRYRANCELQESLDNLFLNFNGLHAAGRGPRDDVLIKSGWGPDGPVGAIPMAGIVPLH
jgi:hypothetical protein